MGFLLGKSSFRVANVNLIEINARFWTDTVQKMAKFLLISMQMIRIC